MPLKSNIDQVSRSYDRMTGSRRRHTAVLSNSMAYAPHLHFKDGFYVIDPDHFAATMQVSVVGAVKAVGMADVVIERGMEHGVRSEINHLRSYTSESRPPARSGEGPRRAHPGHWSDITGNLAAAYGGEINGRGL